MEGRRVSERTTEKFRSELDGLGAVLESRGVQIRRTAQVTPLPDEPLGLIQMFPRDIMVVIGDVVVLCRPKCRARVKELRGLMPLIDELRRSGVKILELPQTPGLFLEGGDVLVDLPNVYVGVGGHATTEPAIRWLAGQLQPSVQVIPVRMSDPNEVHLDCCLSLIGSRLGIIHRPSVVAPLPAALQRHEWIEVDAKTKKQVGVNVLMVDPRTVIIQPRHAELGNALRARGMHTIELPFQMHAASAGSFRCATMPLRHA